APDVVDDVILETAGFGIQIEAPVIEKRAVPANAAIRSGDDHGRESAGADAVIDHRHEVEEGFFVLPEAMHPDHGGIGGDAVVARWQVDVHVPRLAEAGRADSAIA